MFTKILCLLLIVPVTVFAQSPFSACAANESRPTSIRLANCTQQHCVVQRNVPSQIVLTFNSAVAATSARAGIRALVGNTWFPFPLGGQASNVCNNLTSGRCPLAAGATAAYRLSLRIPRIAQSNTIALVQVRLTNEQNQVVTCTRINVLVQ